MRDYLEIDKIILTKLKEGVKNYANLERGVNTNFNTIKNHCKILEMYGLIDVKEYDKHPDNGRTYYEISLTDHGYKVLDRMRE